MIFQVPLASDKIIAICSKHPTLVTAHSVAVEAEILFKKPWRSNLLFNYNRVVKSWERKKTEPNQVSFSFPMVWQHHPKSPESTKLFHMFLSFKTRYRKRVWHYEVRFQSSFLQSVDSPNTGASVMIWMYWNWGKFWYRFLSVANAMESQTLNTTTNYLGINKFRAMCVVSQRSMTRK